jgi:hypothetical protein
MQAAHAAEVEERQRTGHVRGFAPDSVQVLIDEFQDELYFLLLAVSQAVSSRTLLVERGFTLPPIRREKALVAWRNIYEHWDDAARGKIVRAEQRWTAAGGSGVPGSSWTFNDDHGIIDMSGISLIELRRDLSALLAAVEDLEQEAFEMEWPTPEAAAEFMQMDPAEFQRLAAWGVVAMDWPQRGVGLRYRRSDLEKWKARLIAEGDWPPAP